MRFVIARTAKHTVPAKTQETYCKTSVSQGTPYSRSIDQEICHSKGSVRDIFQVR